MDQPVPKVSEIDVVRIVQRDFAEKDRPEILRLLATYGTQSWHGEGDHSRVRLAILKLAGGNPKLVVDWLKEASCDFRDVLAPAEYPEYERFIGINHVSQEEEDAIIARDWQQYQDWLTRP
jgi:hypothetical protein